MKYLIITKGPALFKDAEPQHIEKAAAMLQEGKDSGVIEAAYSLVSGGSVFVVNVDSHEQLAHGMRALGYSAREGGLHRGHDVEVHPIIDAAGALGAYAAKLGQARKGA